MPTTTSWMTDRGDAPAPKARRTAGTRSATASPARRAAPGLQERPASATRAGGGGRSGKPKHSGGDATSRRRLPFEPITDGARTTAAATGGIYNPYNSTPCIPNGLLQKGLSANEVSTNAMLRKQVCDLSVKLRHLSSQSAKATDRLQELRLEHKRLRCSSGVAERELGICVRSMERLTRENQQLRRSVDELQSYTARLRSSAHRSHGGGGAGRPADASGPARGSEASSSSLREQLAAAHAELSGLEARASEEARRREAAEHEAAVLQRSMKLQLEELSGRDDGDVKARLLTLLARGREEGVTLALQASASRESHERALAVSAELQRRCEGSERELGEARRALAEAERRAGDAEARAERRGAEAGGARAERDTAAERGAAAAAELEASRSECAELRASREDLARGLEALESQLETKVAEAREATLSELESARRRLAEERQQHTYAVGEASSVISALRYELDTLRAQHESERRLDGERIRQEAEASDRLGAELRQRDAAQRELLGEVDSLHRDIESLQEVNMGLSARLSEATSSGQRERGRYARMAEEIASLDEQLKQHRAEQRDARQQLQSRLATALEDLAAAVVDRDDLKQRLSGSETRADGHRLREQAAEWECERLREANERLGAGAAEASSSMLEQVASARAERDSLMVRVRELEASLARERGNAERLQSLVDSERRTSSALARQLGTSEAPPAPQGGAAASPAAAVRKSPLYRRLLQEQREQVRGPGAGADPGLRPRSPSQGRLVRPPDAPEASPPRRGGATPSASEVIAQTEAFLGQQQQVGGAVREALGAFVAPSPPPHYHRMAVPVTDVIDEADADGEGDAEEDESDVSMTLSQLATSDAHLYL